MQEKPETQTSITRLSGWFYKISSGRVVLAALVTFILFSIFVLPSQAARADMYTGGIGTPDLSFYYSPTLLNHFSESIGADGRQEYVRARFTFDLVFPLVYGGFLVTAISWLYARIFHQKDHVGLVNLIPLCSVIFDYLENISTSVVMLRFPEPAALASSLAGIFTALKWTLIGISAVMLMLGGFFLLVNLIRDFSFSSGSIKKK